MSVRHIAELNVGRLVAPVGDLRVAPFVDAIDAINALAERSPGFVWRLKDEAADASPGALDLRLPGDGSTLVNMSVWESSEDLRRFVFNTVHRRFYERRAEWFELMATHHVVMWWVEPGVTPTLEEAGARLARLNREGPSEAAFGWDQLPDAAAWAHRRCA